MSKRGWLLVFMSLALFGAACFATGSKAFRAAENAEGSGNLVEAQKLYEEALAKEPNNATYRAALERVKAERAGLHEKDARQKEKAGDWSAAAQSWARAAELMPDHPDYLARSKLCEIKTSSLDPNGEFEAVAKVARQHPKSEVAAKTLESKRSAAYQQQIALGEAQLAAKDYGRAYESFERAKAIDSSMPNFNRERIAQAEALLLAEQGDAELKRDRFVEALELYQQAYDKAKLAEIESRLKRARGRAGPILTKLEAAKERMEKGRHSDALRLFEQVAKMRGAPRSVESSIAELKTKLVGEAAEKASRAAERDNLLPAHRYLKDALEYSALSPAQKRVVLQGLDEIRTGKPALGWGTIQKVGLLEADPLHVASKAFALSGARDVLGRARTRANSSREKGLEILDSIDAFKADLPEITALRRELASGALDQALDASMAEAERGDAKRAGAQLSAALETSKAPAALRERLNVACESLSKGEFAAADEAFRKAQSIAPESRLAARGLAITQVLWRKQEEDAVVALERGTESPEESVAVLERLDRREPKNELVARGRRAIVARMEKGGLSPEVTRQLLGLLNRLETLPKDAAAKVKKGLEALDKGDETLAEKLLGEAKKKAPASALIPLALAHVAERSATKLEEGTKAAAAGDDKSLEALARLLERDPDDAKAKAAINQLLEGARALGAAGKLAEAGKVLGLLAKATKPAPGLKLALDKAVAALANGKLADAEGAFGEAVDLEEENRVAKTGYELAREARLKAFETALSGVREGAKDLEPAKEALRTALAIDPAAQEARQAFEDILKEAERLSARADGDGPRDGDGQRDRDLDARVVALLELANVTSKPKTAQEAITRANTALAEGKHQNAEEAYAKLLQTSESKIAALGKKIARSRRIAALTKDIGELKPGGDLDKAAQAARALAKLDPQHEAVERAVDEAIAHAETFGANGEDESAARFLEIAAAISGEARELRMGISLLKEGKHQEAEDAFAKNSTKLAERAASLARGRRLGTLTAGLSASGSERARSIKELLRKDPTNQRARQALKALLEEAVAAAKRGDDRVAVDNLVDAMLASNLTEAAKREVQESARRIRDGHYAEAEAALANVRPSPQDAEVVAAARTVARERRTQREEVLAKAILGDDDPRPHAEALRASLMVDPRSRVVARAITSLVARAKRSSKNGNDAATASEIEAAGKLELLEPEREKALIEASGLYAKADFVEAQKAFLALGSSGVASRLGAELARERQLAFLRAELERAGKENNVLRQKMVLDQIVEIDPKDQKAKAELKRLEKLVLQQRIDTAKAHKDQGRLSLAWLQLRRALELDPKSDEVKKELADVEAKLKERLDLVLFVDRVERGEEVDQGACPGLDELVRESFMTEASRRTDLGAFVLGKKWSEKYLNKDADAPEVSGVVRLKIDECKSNSMTGDVTVSWTVSVPGDGDAIAEGKVEAQVSQGALPRDEADARGENARRILVSEAVKALLGDVANSKDAMRLWLIALAESGIKANDPEVVVDARARLELIEDGALPHDRIEAVRAFVDRKVE